MCGIIAVVSRPTGRSELDPAWVMARFDAALAALPVDGAPGLVPALVAGAQALEEVDAALRGTAGVRALLDAPSLAAGIGTVVADVDRRVEGLERWADSGRCPLVGPELEAFNGALVRIRDVAWALARDRLRTAEAVADLAGGSAGAAAIDAYWAIQVALSAIDRLEVRGRDSAGLHVLVGGHGLDAASLKDKRRTADELFTSMAVRTPEGHLAFVYKAAAEIGELGDNTRSLRAAIRGDELLHAALASPSARATVLGHTRWASVGIISEANAHPLNQEELSRHGAYVTAVLNGDVDNCADLRERWDHAI